MKIHALGFGLLLGIAAGAGPLAAHNDRDTITAKQPAGIVIALLNAGYDAELSTDAEGDPLINFQGEGYKLNMLFYGCDETTHDNCDSVQLRVGFDRAEPWTPEQAMVIAEKYRFGAVVLDEEGDPYINWDIVTGDGIPASIFLDSIRRFEDTADVAAELIFDGETPAVEAAAASTV